MDNSENKKDYTISFSVSKYVKATSVKEVEDLIKYIRVLLTSSGWSIDDYEYVEE